VGKKKGRPVKSKCNLSNAEMLNRKQSKWQAKLFLNVQETMHKYDTIGSNALNEKDWGFITRYVLPEAKASGQLADLKKKETIIPKLSSLKSNRKTFSPARAAV
jgi:hypothetical protein